MAGVHSIYFTCGYILVFTERGVRYVGSSDVPHVDVEIHNKCATGRKSSIVTVRKVGLEFQNTVPSTVFYLQSSSIVDKSK